MIYDNEIGVLTNNPSFPLQLHNLSNYAALSNKPVIKPFSDLIPFDEYSRGMGALGLPGDLSSESRFVRATFHKLNQISTGKVTDIFHLLSTVAMPKGSVALGENLYELTEYSSAVNLSTLIYYYRTYSSKAIYSASLFNEDLNRPSLISYPLVTENNISSHN